MKRCITVLCVSAAAAVIISAAPEAAINSVPSAETISARSVMYSETLTSCGQLSYIGQNEVTAALPLVIERFTVSEGDEINVGDTIAVVDKKASAALLESLGQVPQLAVAAANISTAVSLIPQQITADCAGRVLSTASTGKAVEAGSSILSVAGTDTLIITAPVSEQYISRIGLGQQVTFSLAAYPEEIFSGTVAQISSAARSQYSGSVLETVVDVIVAPDKFDERFRSGLSADVKFSLSEPRRICVLPYEAIGQDEGGEYVYVYENGAARKRKIFTGAEFSDGTEIIKGVTETDLVLTAPEALSASNYIRMEQQ